MDDIRNEGLEQGLELTLYKATEYTKVDELKIWAELRVGCAYLPHSRGLSCNTFNRYAAMAEYPWMASQLRSVCPVISGKIKSCSAAYDSASRCKFYDYTIDKYRQSYGALELITCAFSENGIPLSGVRAQDVLLHSLIKYRATIKYLPTHMPFYGIVFNVAIDTGEVTRIGLYDGTTDSPNVIYVKSYRDGVVKEPFTQARWSHWAFVDKIYSAEETVKLLEKAMEDNTLESKGPYTATVITDSKPFLNIRHQADYASSIVGQVANGEEVLVLSDIGDLWSKISYKDTVGYSVRQYLKTK